MTEFTDYEDYPEEDNPNVKTTPWPEDQTEVIDFSDLHGPMLECFRRAYDIKRNDEPISYQGYEHPKFTGAYASTRMAEWLSDRELAYYAERDHDEFDIILGCAIRLGMEQGRRMALKEASEMITFATLTEASKMDYKDSSQTSAINALYRLRMKLKDHFQKHGTSNLAWDEG